MKACKDCKNFNDVGLLCVRGRRPSGFDPIYGEQKFKYKTLEYAFIERESILPWKCGKKGRHFEPK